VGETKMLYKMFYPDIRRTIHVPNVTGQELYQAMATYSKNHTVFDVDKELISDVDGRLTYIISLANHLLGGIIVRTGEDLDGCFINLNKTYTKVGIGTLDFSKKGYDINRDVKDLTFELEIVRDGLEKLLKK
jgi:hypothetical protein